MLLDRLDPIESTILYGPGGVGKGTLACHWIVRLTEDDHKVLILDYENHGSEWARRIHGLAGAAGVDRVTWIAPHANAMGSIWDHSEWLAKQVADHGYTYLVIDSAVMAVGGMDPTKPETAMRYGAALQAVNVPSLTLAHVTKMHDEKYPFGSVFWHNLARVTYSLMPKGEAVLLTCRKANNYLKPSAQTVLATWHDGRLGEVSETPASWGLKDEIADTLAAGDAGGMTPTEIAEAMSEGRDASEKVGKTTIHSALSRDFKTLGTSSRFTAKADGKWALRQGAQ
jgi:hypothetical protein